VSAAWAELARTASNVGLAILPLVALFAAFQLVFLRLPRREVTRILAGTFIAAAGLFLFLLGVGVGFLPFGRAIGEALGRMENDWALLALGALLGFVTTWGEPAVRVLADQVQDATSGSIRASVVLQAVCIGVAAAAGIGMLRIAHEIPLIWLLAPGYLLVLVLLRTSGAEFAAIAVDAGGVATGPLANTFLLALALGAAASMGRDPVVYGLGFVSIIALAPLVSVMVLGTLVTRRQRPKEPS
jgi:hypothetical protein